MLTNAFAAAVYAVKRVSTMFAQSWLSPVTRPGPGHGSRAGPGPGSSTHCVLDPGFGSRVHGSRVPGRVTGRARAGSRVTTKITARRTNRSQSGFSVIHKDPPQYPSLRGFFYSHQGGRPTSTSPRSQISTSKKLHNCKKAANYVHTLTIARPLRISNNAHAGTVPSAAS